MMMPLQHMFYSSQDVFTRLGTWSLFGAVAVAALVGMSLDQAEASHLRDHVVYPVPIESAWVDRGEVDLIPFRWDGRPHLMRYYPKTGHIQFHNIALNGAITEMAARQHVDELKGYTYSAILQGHGDSVDDPVAFFLNTALGRIQAYPIRSTGLYTKRDMVSMLPRGVKPTRLLTWRNGKGTPFLLAIDEMTGAVWSTKWYPRRSRHMTWKQCQQPMDGRWSGVELLNEGNHSYLVWINEEQGRLAIQPFHSDGRNVVLDVPTFDIKNRWRSAGVELATTHIWDPVSRTRVPHLALYWPYSGGGVVAPVRNGMPGEQEEFQTTPDSRPIVFLEENHQTWLLTHNPESGREQVFSVALDAEIHQTKPLVGGVTDTTATFWMYDKGRAGLSGPWIHWDSASRSPEPLKASPHVPGAWTLSVSNLTPATTYAYAIRQNQGSDSTLLHEGTFQTAPKLGSTQNIRMVVTSCMHVAKYPQQPAWNSILADRPDFQLIIGDTVYVDSHDPQRFMDEHLRQRSVDAFGEAVSRIPTMAVWDDHDYGKNNSDRMTPVKQEGLRLFQSLFPNPYWPEGREGAYFNFTWGSVEFFVLDVRYHRDPNYPADGHDDGADPGKTMLGQEQLNWLKTGLANSTAKFKVIASGSTLDSHPVDCWQRYQAERQAIYDWIRNQHIAGVLFMTGDVHDGFIKVHPAQKTLGYPLVEVVSSGVANAPNFPYGLIDFHLEGDEPFVMIHIKDGDGAIRQSQTLFLRDLTF